MPLVETDDFGIYVEVVVNLHWKSPSANVKEEQYRIEQQTRVNVIAHDIEKHVRDYMEIQLGKK